MRMSPLTEGHSDSGVASHEVSSGYSVGKAQTEVRAPRVRIVDENFMLCERRSRWKMRGGQIKE